MVSASLIENVVGPFVDGTLVASGSEEVLDVIDPSNGRCRLSIPAGCERDAARAVASGRRAYSTGAWSEAPPSFRKRVLHRLADSIATEASALNVLDAGEMGKPVGEVVASAAAAAELVHFYAEALDKVVGDVYGSDGCTFVAQRRVPRGVIAAITPWNFPTFNAALKFAPALAAGNSVVLKPSELSSRSAIHLAHLAVEAGIPPGVLNVVPGAGSIVGRTLGLHHDVDMLTFTGSTDVGRLMLQYAGQSNMKVVMTECGGKSPHIVFDDGVDLNAVAATVSRSILTNQGQICSAGSRLLVHRAVEGPLLETITRRLGEIVMGNALDPKTTFGPVASAGQCARVMRYISAGMTSGAELITGGRQALKQTGGYFVEPTIFASVSPGSAVAQEEIFGPVLAVLSFEDEQEAIRIANNTIYGLTAYVWTTNLSTGLRVAKALRSSVLVNAVAPSGEGAGHAASLEPAGQSGIGVEGGIAGLESYLRRQLLWINHA